jgi:hypothetical protein
MLTLMGRTMKHPFALLPVALIAILDTAGAQAPNSDQLRALIASDFHKELINRALASLPPTVFQRCPTLVSNLSHVTPLKPVSFGSDGFPNGGMWRETFPVSGCGNDTVLNFYFVATSDKK